MSMSELAREVGETLGTAYFWGDACKGKTKEEFLEVAKTVVSWFYSTEEDRKAFMRAWEEAWETNDLRVELLSDEDQVIAECTRLFDRRKLVVERQVFRRARLCFGSKEWDGGYDTTYDYATPDGALSAMQRCLTGNVAPTGWQRHYDTGRYRINGDEKLEYIKDHDYWTLEQNIEYVVKVTKGFDRVVAHVIPDNTITIGDDSLKDTQCFFVTSETASDVLVNWVFHYRDRNVVIGEDEIYNASMKESVVRRLKDA